MPVKASYLLLGGAGMVFVWSGVRGKPVTGIFRSLIGGENPSKLPQTQNIAGVTPTAQPGAPVNAPGAVAIPAGAKGAMLTFMLSQVGHPYLSKNPERFGPQYYDCSGLIYTAAHAAGINLPKAMAIASLEAVWFASQGNKVVNRGSVPMAADLLFFTGAHPDSNVEFPPIGHVGMATDGQNYVSAYDTVSGVLVKNIDSGLVAIIRLP